MPNISKQTVGQTAGALSWFLNSKGRSRVVGGILLLSLLFNPAAGFSALPQPGASVNLAWTGSPSPEATGYRIYYGAASGNYSNSVPVGNVTATNITGLANGVPYFFAVVAYTATGLESAFSNEIVYVPGGALIQINVAANRQVILMVAGQNGQTYDIEASQTLTSWTVIGSVTVGASGSANFTDVNAASFGKRFYRTRAVQP
jgi:hypothetical protein